MWPLTGLRAGDADAANGRGHASKSHNAQKERKSPIDPQQRSIAGFPDYVTDFGNRDDSVLSMAICETSRSPFRFEGSTSSNLTSLAASGNKAGQRGATAALLARPRIFDQSDKSAGGITV
jgi:hypothetical protein